jgi:hypothetical protein
MEAHKNETPQPAIAGLSSNQTNEEAKMISQEREPIKGLSTPVAPVLDLSTADDFLSTIDPKRRITYQTFDDRKQTGANLARVAHGAITRHAEFLNRLAASGAGIYFCLCLTDGKGRKKKNVSAFRGFWVDLDGAPLDPVLKWTLKPSIITETSPGRYHAFWLFKAPILVSHLSLDQYATTQKKLAKLFGGDPAVCDAPHVARLPGSWHQKNPNAPFRVRVVYGDWESLRYTVEEFERELKSVPGTAVSHKSAIGARKTGGDPAPSREAALACLRNIKNVPGSGFDDRGKFVGLVAGIEVMCAPFRGDDEIEEAIWHVYLMYPNDVEYVQHILDSNLDKDRGFTWVMKITGQGFELAQIEFADRPCEENMPPDPGEVAEEKMFAENLYVASLDRFLHLPTMVLRKPKAFCTAYTDSGKFGGRKTAEVVFLNNKARGRRYECVTYRPGKGLIISEVHPETGALMEMVNLWTPSSLKPEAATDADVAPFLDHVRWHFPSPQEHNKVLDWMAFVAQRPGEKVNYILAVIGVVEGTGKDAMFEPIRRIVGEHNAATVNANALRNDFNAHYIKKQLAIFNEVQGLTPAEMNQIKELGAAPPHTLWVNEKNVPQYPIPNIVSCVMFSNHLDALSPGKHDRRYLVLHSQVEKRPPKSYFKALWDWFDAGGCAKVYGWLMTRDISQFDPREPAAMTDLKLEMIRNALPGPVRWCLNLFEEGGIFKGRTIITVGEILDEFERSRTAPKGVNHQHASEALREAGFQTSDQLQVRFKDGVKRLWISNPLLAQLKADQLRERYEAQKSSRAEEDFAECEDYAEW